MFLSQQPYKLNLLSHSKNSIMKKVKYLFLLCLFASMSCETNFDNENSPTEDQVLSTPNGLTGLIVGIQSQFTLGGASGLYTNITASGLSTGELRVLNAGNADIAQISNGGTNIAPSNTVITNLWTNTVLVRNNADKLIRGSESISDPDFSNGIRIFGLFYKALAISTTAQFWESLPVETGINQSFVTRLEALSQASSNVDEALSLLGGGSLSSAITAKTGTNINMNNSLRALSARINIMLGNYEKALSMATSVDLNSKSVFLFSSVSQNPIFRSSLTTNNVYDVNADFGLTGTLAPNSNDERISFYLTANAANGKGFFKSDSESIPVYLPGEMLLIKAEALAKTNQLTLAVDELNKVLTKTATQDVFGLGANLPAYSGAMTQEAILIEIYRNRAIELYMTGMKLEDSRRFNRPGPNDANKERTRNFYPYPNAERDSNPNTPPDPAI